MKKHFTKIKETNCGKYICNRDDKIIFTISPKEKIICIDELSIKNINLIISEIKEVLKRLPICNSIENYKFTFNI